MRAAARRAPLRNRGPRSCHRGLQPRNGAPISAPHSPYRSRRLVRIVIVALPHGLARRTLAVTALRLCSKEPRPAQRCYLRMAVVHRDLGTRAFRAPTRSFGEAVAQGLQPLLMRGQRRRRGARRPPSPDTLAAVAA